jgi:hypothetical protein
MMNEREREVMAEMLAFERYAAEAGYMRGARPMDVGGSNGSHHSATLRRMASKGWLIDVGHGRSSGGKHGTRRTYKYKTTEVGRAAYTAEPQTAGEP